jgi:predicted lipid-binding transport protein (Tim44 family)
MNNGFQFLDIILFAMIAAFLILRLRSVLGRHKDSGEQKRENRPESFSVERSNDNVDSNVFSLPRAKSGKDSPEEKISTGTALESGIYKIKNVANDFDPTEFLNGAQAAFEMIIQAFAKGDSEKLETLLNSEVYDNFLKAIRSREAEKQTLENTLIRIVSCEIIEASMIDSVANITVKIVSEQINVTRSQHGDVVNGDPESVSAVTDIWTFARDTDLQNPNWMLIATRSLD